MEEAIILVVTTNKTQKEIAEEIGISPFTFTKWKKTICKELSLATTRLLSRAITGKYWNVARDNML